MTAAARSRKPSRRRPEVAMRITARRREEIRRLAAALAEIAPATTRGKGYCVQQVAIQMGLKDYWKSRNNKKATIAHLLEHVFRRHPRKPKKLVLEIVHGGVLWKARKGERVSPAQLEAIIEPMEALGFRIRKDIEAIEVPEPGRVRQPSQDVVALLDRLQLHKALTDDVAGMFRDGHFNEAVRKALERFEKLIQDALGDHKTFGRDLMARAFGGKSPLIQLNELTTTNDRSEQEGFKFLTMGAMAALRNPLSHGDVTQMNAVDAIERLVFVSMLFKRLESAVNWKEVFSG